MIRLLVVTLWISGCATHPNNIEPSENATVVPCEQAIAEYEHWVNKQERVFAADFILVSLIGLPTPWDYEKEVSQVKANVLVCGK